MINNAIDFVLSNKIVSYEDIIELKKSKDILNILNCGFSLGDDRENITYQIFFFTRYDAWLKVPYKQLPEKVKVEVKDMLRKRIEDNKKTIKAWENSEHEFAKHNIKAFTKELKENETLLNKLESH